MKNHFQNSSYMFAHNAVFLESLYKKYLENPQSLDASWISYFESLEDDKLALLEVVRAKLPKESSIFQNSKIGAVASEYGSVNYVASAAASLLQAYVEHGHTAVNLDPLNLSKPDPSSLLEPSYHGLAESDLDQKVRLSFLQNFGDITIGDAIKKARSIYANKIGLEFAHLESAEEKRWLSEKMEQSAHLPVSDVNLKKKILQNLLAVANFENFLHIKFPGAKRFSAEGGEAAMVAMEFAVDLAAASGLEEVVIGMAHRGRLNIMTRVAGKPYSAIIAKFSGALDFPEDVDVPGDVKYHIGASADRDVNGKKIHISLTPNPSHLEASNSVVLGRVRAKQDLLGDAARAKVMAILVHGDAAFAGQGSVFESLMSSQLDAYRVGGALHIVINNQIGFTANAKAGRFGRYCTDVAKAISAPILHVNSADIESVITATTIAYEYREKFRRDIFLDVVCYRKYGHNEGDEPLFTQPLMYKVISALKNPADYYAERLIAEQAIKREDYQKMLKDFREFLNAEFEVSKTYKTKKADRFEGVWRNFVSSRSDEKSDIATGVAKEQLVALGQAIAKKPDDFNLNSKVARQFAAKAEMMKSGQGLDWAMGESLAYATLLNEGYNIRITGQDVERGTFSHRHAVLTDQLNERKYVPLNNLGENQRAKIEIHNSNLSEFAVLAFEYGYSVASPNTLTIWEAQFGDFANGAQVIIDQFIASGEAKWMRSSGLVLLLPHAYEGQGAEHSSARVERFLQLCAKDNMQVVNCTTPASFFHVVRRQLHRNYRIPLIVMTPKSLLRHEMAISSLNEMDTNTSFSTVIGDKVVDQNAKKLVLCSGKVYYDLVKKRQELSANHIAIVRLEQLYPFPVDDIKRELLNYSKAQVVWCQEEHLNGGPYLFVKYRIESMMKELDIMSKELLYCGRDESSSTAAGYVQLHQRELDEFMKAVFNQL